MKKSILITCSLFLIPSLLAADTAAIDAAVAKGMKFLLAQQQADGHFSDSNTPALTALPLWAMTATGDVKDNVAAKKAAEFVLKCQQPDGGFYAKLPERPNFQTPKLSNSQTLKPAPRLRGAAPHFL